MSIRRICVTAAVLTTATVTGVAVATPGFGVSFGEIVAGDLDGPVKAKSSHVQLKTLGRTRVSIADVTFASGGYSGWHRHQGVVVAVVRAGVLTRYDENCVATEYGPGESFVEDGDELVRTVNHTAEPATARFAFVLAEGAPLVTDAPAPACAT